MRSDLQLGHSRCFWEGGGSCWLGGGRHLVTAVDGGRAGGVLERGSQPAVLLDLELVPARLVEALLLPGPRLLPPAACRATISSRRHSAGGLLELNWRLLELLLRARLHLGHLGAAALGQALPRGWKSIDYGGLAAPAASSSGCVGRGCERWLRRALVQRDSDLALLLWPSEPCASLGWLLKARGTTLAVLQPVEVTAEHVLQRQLLLYLICLSTRDGAGDAAARTKRLSSLARRSRPLGRHCGGLEGVPGMRAQLRGHS